MCDERLRLLYEYHDAVECFALATTALKIGASGSLDEYMRLKQECTKAMIRLRAAKLAHWHHREQHQC